MWLWARAASVASLLSTVVTVSAQAGTTYHYDDPQISGTGSVGISYPSFAHQYFAYSAYDISASVAFNFDTATTSGTFAIGGSQISSATLALSDYPGTGTIPVQGSLTLTLGAVTAWDLFGTCNGCVDNPFGDKDVVTNYVTVETSSSTPFDTFSWFFASQSAPIDTGEGFSVVSDD